MADEDPKEPEVLISVPTEAEAAIIVAALVDEGIEAEATGGYTASFTTAAPGFAQVVVHQADLERAKEILAELHQLGADMEAEAEVEEEDENQAESEA